ncbi:hypothetical protein JCM1840_002969, partial [Sporobolomyces johnsonii]
PPTISIYGGTLLKLDEISGPVTGRFAPQMPNGYEHLTDLEILSMKFALDKADTRLTSLMNQLGKYLRAYTGMQSVMVFFDDDSIKHYRAQAGVIPPQLTYLFKKNRARPLANRKLSMPHLQLLHYILEGFEQASSSPMLLSAAENIKLMDTPKPWAMCVALATATELIGTEGSILDVIGPVLWGQTLSSVLEYEYHPVKVVIGRDSSHNITDLLTGVTQATWAMRWRS